MATQHQSQPAAVCPVCDGTGWKQVAVPGKASRMTRCDCRISARNQQLLEKAGIPARYKLVFFHKGSDPHKQLRDKDHSQYSHELSAAYFF